MTGEPPSIPGYKILDKLGHGGMATVYLAVQESIGRQVALKIMSNKLGEDNIWAKRFIHEAQVIAQLSHPNIVPVFDVGTHNGQFYISMELMNGGSLKDKMLEGLSTSKVLKILAGVAAGLDFAGEKGFVHRDIKPDNIMFRADGSPVILDFGIVKQKGDSVSKMTQTGIIVGTSNYMSPEQAQGKELDERSDIYSLGIMFYELLTGHPPFKGDSDVAVLLKHINELPPPLPKQFEALQPIIDRALAKRPEERYNRAREIIEHLQRMETKIKAMLALNQHGATQAMPLSSEDITDARDAITDGDATAIIATGEVQAIEPVEDADITKVLSSAKATIKDFSVEARERRARATKRIITSITLVAITAITYVGYQQLYIVPQERAAADEKIRVAQLKAQAKIDTLISEAKKAIEQITPPAKSTLDLRGIDKVVKIYREVLILDPENANAKAILQEFGDNFVHYANDALKKRDLDKAETYRDYAQQLSPQHIGLVALSSGIKSLRAETAKREFDNKFKAQEIKTLLELAKSDIKKSDSFSESAYTKLQQVLRIDENNQEAQQEIDKMLTDLYDKTVADISQEKIRSARSNMTLLESYYSDNKQLQELRQRLDTTSSRLSKENRKTKLLTRASRLQREKRTIGINDELRDIYLTVLKIDKRNTIALDGIKDTSSYDAQLAEQAIQDQDFARADKQIAIIEKFTPNYQGLNKLRSSLHTARSAATDATKKLADAAKLIDNQKSGQQKREALKRARALVEEAQKLNAANPKIKTITTDLENAYVEEITSLIASQKNDLVDDYFSDSVHKTWPTDRILKLQITQKSRKKEKAKPKRVITGGF